MALVKHNNNSISDITSVNLPQGKMTLISEQTASGSASISFTSGIDSTYPIYKFEFINIHPATDNVRLQFNLSTDGGSNYNVTKTSTSFRQQHGEDDSSGVLEYDTALDLAQSTADQPLGDSGNDNDQALSGYLQLFNPSSTTYVKHFIGTSDGSRHNDLQQQYFIAGYGNTTSAINAVRFQMSSGNIDAGTIKMYGIKGD
jgi:hypothetical protein